MCNIEIISKYISSFDIIHTYNNSHYLIKCKIKDILETKIVNWEYNRPPDMIRCNDIAKYIYNKRPELDWLFYIIYDKVNHQFKIIDGIHRYNALQIIKKENHKHIDYITPNNYGSDGDAKWLYEKYILISLRFDTTMGENIDLFQAINKSNPVPELYMTNNNEEKRRIIEEIVKEWCSRYNSHFSSTQKPNIPNINRDRFIEFIDYVYNKYNINSANSHILYEKLYELNNNICNNIPKKISIKALEKCKKTGCYLFLVKKEILEDMI